MLKSLEEDEAPVDKGKDDTGKGDEERDETAVTSSFTDISSFIMISFESILDSDLTLDFSPADLRPPCCLNAIFRSMTDSFLLFISITGGE